MGLRGWVAGAGQPLCPHDCGDLLGATAVGQQPLQSVRAMLRSSGGAVGPCPSSLLKTW